MDSIHALDVSTHVDTPSLATMSAHVNFKPAHIRFKSKPFKVLHRYMWDSTLLVMDVKEDYVGYSSAEIWQQSYWAFVADEKLDACITSKHVFFCEQATFKKCSKSYGIMYLL